MDNNLKWMYGSSDVSAAYYGEIQVYPRKTGTLNPTNGVYIQDTEGYFYTEAEWDGTHTPNGVAVITEKCSFVIALEKSSSGQWGGYNTTVSGITTTQYGNVAKIDYDGEAQTTTIINYLKGKNDDHVTGAPAAESCRAYTFPNGKKGYLGAAGEWQAAFDNKTAVESALSKCGGVSSPNIHWTSTQYSGTRCWTINWRTGTLDAQPLKYNNLSVRPLCSI